MDAPSFSQRLVGRFDGFIRIAEVERLLRLVGGYDGWYLVAPRQELPAQPVDGARAATHLRELVEEILTEERGVWTTMIYAQTMDDPWIIKVFHPRRAGHGCGAGGGVLPWWVLSRHQPGPVPEWLPPPEPTPGIRHWWKILT